MNFRFTLTIDPSTRVSCLEALVIWSNYSKVTNDSGKDISVHGPGNNVSANVNSSSFVHRNDTISKETRRRTKPGLMLNDVISLRKAASTGRESSCQSRNGTNLRPNDIPSPSFRRSPEHENIRDPMSIQFHHFWRGWNESVFKSLDRY